MPLALDALLEHAGYALPLDRALLRITGADATRWLNGMVTNSAQALAPGEGNYNFLLNSQGRIQADGLLYRLPDGAGEPEFLLATHGDQMESVQAHLDRFIIMDDVELAPAYADQSTLLLAGPEAAAHLQALHLPAPDPLRLAQVDTPDGALLLLAPPPALTPVFEVRAAGPAIAALAQALQNRGVAALSPELLAAWRVLAGTPRVGVDIRERELPQETNQSQALHFAKGCYLGQEIVERTRSRGQVNRLLTPLRLEGTPPESLPAPLEAAGKLAGELTSTALVELQGAAHLLALGYVRREALDTHAVLSYAGGHAFPRRAGETA